MDNVCIFTKVIHDQSGEELETGCLGEGVYVESMELDGPKLILSYRDPLDRIKNDLRIREYDTLTVSFGDAWREAGVSEKDVFTVLTIRTAQDGRVKLNLMAKTVYDMKAIAEQTRVFTQRSVADIIGAFAGGAKLDIGKFPVVENYHCIAGERPSSLLRQIASEQGAHIWHARGAIHMKRFAELAAQSPALTFYWGVMNKENGIARYTRPSGQMRAQEKSARSFTGWNEVEGRVKTSADMPILAKAGSKPTAITSSPNPFVLGQAPIAKKTAIDFVSLGNMSVTPGQKIRIVWHTGDPANPVNEGLPENVVVECVAHWYSAQKYYCRIKGAVALEPF